MAMIKIFLILTFLMSTINGCTNGPSNLMLVDNKGIKHFHTLQRVTNLGESLRFCELHDTWEYVRRER